MENKIKLNILGLSYSQTQMGAYALVLAEEKGNRRIPIIIGGAEAQAIAIQLEGLNTPRPLTHDLFVGFATAFNIIITEVVIFKLEEGIFYSELHCDNGESTIKIDARTSDAVALALRFDCPIYTDSKVMDQAGIILDSDEPKDVDDSPEEQKGLSAKNDEELQQALETAINNEDYEYASVIRDEINLRKKK